MCSFNQPSDLQRESTFSLENVENVEVNVDDEEMLNPCDLLDNVSYECVHLISREVNILIRERSKLRMLKLIAAIHSPPN